MTNKKYLNRWNRSLQNNYGKPTITLVKGKGVLVTDADGKTYMDFLGGCSGLGRRVVRAGWFGWRIHGDLGPPQSSTHFDKSEIGWDRL